MKNEWITSCDSVEVDRLIDWEVECGQDLVWPDVPSTNSGFRFAVLKSG
jgi:hypothetical protein